MKVLDAAQVAQLRADFPALANKGRDGQPIAYLDAGATAQKPSVVLERLEQFYRQENAAVHRGTHLLGDRATEAFETGRAQIAGFLGIANPDELCFTSGATMALNALAYAFINASAGLGPHATGKDTFFHCPGPAPAQLHRFTLDPGDKIVVSVAEHHANLVPWQQVATHTGAQLAWLELDEQGRIRTDKENLALIDKSTKVVALTHMSNVTGAITDLEPICENARAAGALVVLDTCQSACHLPLEISNYLVPLGVDFAVFSGHKMYGPTGVGALWGRADLLEAMPPFLTGGSMVGEVTREGTTFQEAPARFEAGTQPVAQIAAWAAACAYLQNIGMEQIAARENQLVEYTLQTLGNVAGVRLLGPCAAAGRGGVFSFEVPGVHPHDVGQFLDAQSVAVRVGHHCAQPIHRHFGVYSSTRATYSLTTTEAEIDRLCAALAQVRKFFQVSDR